VLDYVRDVVVLASARRGTIGGATGARISIIFGASSARRDEAPLAALGTARAIRSRAGALASDASARGFAVDCAARVALATGPCLVGPIARSAYAAIGSASTRASHLHARAAAGAIVCDAPTWSRLRGHTHGVQDLVTAVPDAPASSRRRVFRREGEFWTISYDGAVCRVKDSKGIKYVGRLLAQPHTEIHARDLAADVPPDAIGRSDLACDLRSLGLRVGALGDAGFALDEKAKAAYRRRRDDIRDHLRHSDRDLAPDERLRLESEMEALAHQLAAAVGLRGRDRKLLDVSERARINVTRAMRAAIERIARCNGELGRHLVASIRTGTFCSYNPRPATAADAWQMS
jgi:hypothetical protein